MFFWDQHVLACPPQQWRLQKTYREFKDFTIRKKCSKIKTTSTSPVSGGRPCDPEPLEPSAELPTQAAEPPAEPAAELLAEPAEQLAEQSAEPPVDMDGVTLEGEVSRGTSVESVKGGVAGFLCKKMKRV